jgi:hypothetical protein
MRPKVAEDLREDVHDCPHIGTIVPFSGAPWSCRKQSIDAKANSIRVRPAISYVLGSINKGENEVSRRYLPHEFIKRVFGN